MKISLTFALLALTASMPCTAVCFDRAEQHAERLTGLDLSSRTARPQATNSVTLASDFSDIAVSGSVTPAHFTQENARVVGLSDGGWLTAWYDNRQGSYKIFWQRYDSLDSPVGKNELVAGSTTGTDYVDPILSVDTLGRVYLAFRDRTAGLVFAARYTSDLAPDLAPFLVNDTGFASFAGPHDMTVFPDGQMVVVWENNTSLASSIEMRLFSPNGSSLLGPVTVNSGGNDVNRWVPSVAVAPGSGFVVAWEDYSNGRADIFARQFTGAGSAVGGDFTLVPPPNDAADQYAPRICYSDKDHYVVGWVDRRQGQEIYLQRYDQTTGLTGTNQLVSGGDSLALNWDLDLAVSPDGPLQAVWSNFGVGSDILSQELDSGLAVSGAPVVINASSIDRRWSPGAFWAESDRAALVWTEFADEHADIHFLSYNPQVGPGSGTEMRANDDSLGAHSTEPFITASSIWYDLICFTDRRNDAGDIFVRAVSVAGDPHDVEQRANQDAGANLQSEPSLASTFNRTIVVWNDSRNVGGLSGQRIYGRYCSQLGEFNQPEFMISDSAATAVKASPVVILSSSGQGLVTWIDNRDIRPQVWGRWLGADGTPDGNEFMISEAASDTTAADLFLGQDSSDHFYVLWLDAGLTSPTVKGKRYDLDKSQSGTYNWSSTISGVAIEELATAVSSNGTISLLWTGTQTGTRRAFLTQLASGGSVLVEPFEVTDDPSADVTDPTISVSNDNYLSTAWVDRRESRRSVYYQLISPTLTPIGANQPAATGTPEFMETPSTHTYRGRAWFAWVDPRENGLNIYLSSVVYSPTDINDPTENSLPKSQRLSQNYPNPFNPATVIGFALSSNSDVTLSIYNALGQRVKTLVDCNLPVGEHTVTWDGTDESGERVASGIYLYRLKADNFVDSRKMLLLK